MICEKCAGESQTVQCRHCGAEIVKLGPYCYECGHSLEERSEASPAGGDDDLDLSRRILCSDGACIGVIDEKGICKVCGKAYVPEP